MSLFLWTYDKSLSDTKHLRIQLWLLISKQYNDITSLNVWCLKPDINVKLY